MTSGKGTADVGGGRAPLSGSPATRSLAQEIVNGADTSTSYGVVVFLSNCTT